MKKILLKIVLASSFLSIANANILEKNETIPETHQVLVSTTKKIDLSGDIKKEFVYFGKLKDYSEITTNLVNNGGNGAINGLTSASGSLANMAGGGLQAAGAGLGIGLAMGIATHFIDQAIADERYILVYDITNSKNEKTRKVVFYISPSFNKEDIIKNYLEKNI